MGWNQWALLRFTNKTFEDTLMLKFPNTGDHWGWPFADTEDTNNRIEIQYGDIERTEIKPQTSYSYGQTGKQNEWSGMSGTVEIYTKATEDSPEEKIARIYYSCPWSGSNEFTIMDVSPGWNVKPWGANFNSGALGSITTEIRRT
ncbi:hypothetical protein BHE90_000712 [Fusarium euwallaceae]|uniref:Uncharacterized protein n=5 Tax=Fusarium solani species complex TaxID=232080 RepID=A0A3M2SSA0_9HYPO|nr:hypothetical protein CDV36_000196 [Fusarium kuroshium]RSL85619.1 hypothetical protein CEP51_003212 [Fusarium floridanum]RSM07277.1 hypothetical protein CEP52_005324 [Fusarium oligoseptatum]RSM20181.1 hypothetical protein CDV31_000976 [Fusarium ambrosium]RTE84717.1 hypothetical protein BHE90_000712 [Fusarium euwallaceae]